MEEKKTTVSGSFYKIQSFMIDLFGLSGAELLTFAFIYSFSSAEKGGFHGSVSYLAKRTASSDRSAAYAIASLLKKDLITKKKCESSDSLIYSVSASAAAKIAEVTAKIAEGGCKNCSDTTAKIADNTYLNNTNINTYPYNSAHGGARSDATNKEVKGNGGYNGGYYGKGNNGGNKGGYYSKKGWCTYDDGKDAEYWIEAFNTAIARSYADD